MASEIIMVCNNHIPGGCRHRFRDITVGIYSATFFGNIVDLEKMQIGKITFIVSQVRSTLVYTVFQ